MVKGSSSENPPRKKYWPRGDAGNPQSHKYIERAHRGRVRVGLGLWPDPPKAWVRQRWSQRGEPTHNPSQTHIRGGTSTNTNRHNNTCTQRQANTHTCAQTRREHQANTDIPGQTAYRDIGTRQHTHARTHTHTNTQVMPRAHIHEQTHTHARSLSHAHTPTHT